MEIKTYLNQSVKNGYLLRWTRMPILVYIAPMNFYSKQGEDGIYRKLVIKALETWEKASEGLISFSLVDNLLNSQMNIDWKRVDRKALGHCTYNFDNLQRLYGADVSIGLTDGKIHQAYNSKDEVFHTILHEIGHGLGLGHSPYITDIMYTPHRYGIVSLSENDIYSIQWLYSLPPATPVRQIAGKYSIMTDDNIDMVIEKIEAKYNADHGVESNSQDNNTSTNYNMPQERNLLDETTNIAEVRKYNLMIQNIGLTGNTQKFFLNQQHNKK